MTTLPLWIGLYEIGTLKYVDVKTEDLKKIRFGTKRFNPYDPHGICKSHCAKVYYPWIHGVSHWSEEDPWRCCYNFSRLNESINMAIEWKAPLQAVALEEETIIAIMSSKPIHDKSKRNISKNVEANQRYKFKRDPLFERVDLEIDAKR